MFQDDTPFDAEAVKANIERGQTVEGSAVVADLSSISEVQVVDPSTVVLVLSAPNSALPGILSSRAGIMVSPAAFGDGLDIAPVGAGPYRVTDYLPDDHIEFERFDGYWDTTYGGPDTVDWRIIPDETTRLNALRAGEVDAALITGAQQQDAELAGFTVDPRPTLSYQTIYLNRAKSEFDNVLVRQALSHAIDRQAFVDAVLFGAGAATVQDFPEGYYAHNPDYPADFYEFDPEQGQGAARRGRRPRRLHVQHARAEPVDVRARLPGGPADAGRRRHHGHVGDDRRGLGGRHHVRPGRRRRDDRPVRWPLRPADHDGPAVLRRRAS